MVRIYKFFIAILVALRVVLFFFIGVVPYYLIFIFSRKLAEKWLYVDFRAVGRFIMLVSGLKAEVSGNTENLNLADGPVCYFSNHTSLLDIVVFVSACKIKAGYVAKKELMFVPIVNLTIWALHGVFIDRRNLKKSVASIGKAAESVKKGHPVVIFPEGTRSKTGKLLPFKHGSFRLATKSGAKIVPLVIKGARPALEDRRKVFVRTTARVFVGNVYDVNNYKTREELNNMCESLEKDVNNIYNNL